MSEKKNVRSAKAVTVVSIRVDMPEWWTSAMKPRVKVRTPAAVEKNPRLALSRVSVTAKRRDGGQATAREMRSLNSDIRFAAVASLKNKHAKKLSAREQAVFIQGMATLSAALAQGRLNLDSVEAVVHLRAAGPPKKTSPTKTRASLVNVRC